MTLRVLIADALAPEGLEVFAKAKADVRVDDRNGIERAELLKVLPEYDALVVRSRTNVDAEVIGAGKKLQIIGRAGIGVDNIDVGAATRAGVVVMNTPEGNATTTAEHTLALILSLARWVPQATASMKGGKWDKKKFMGRELRGKTLGVLGLGNIGRLVAERARGLKMRVVGHDPFFSAEAAAKLDVELLPLDAVIREADVLTVHVPLSDETRGLVSHAQVAAMKPGVLLVNCARGGIYDERALLEGLQSGKIGGVALDVFEEEPPPAGHPLVAHERVICTPHLGASTQEAQVLVSVAVAEQILAYAAGEPARNAVNLPRISATELKVIAPWLALAERMGAFCGQLSKGSLKGIDVQYTGQAGERGTDVLTTAVVSGVLQAVTQRSVNTVNARVLAEERDVVISETKQSASHPSFVGTIRVTVTSDEAHTVCGTLFGGGRGRFVEVDGVDLEVVPEGHLLVIHNHDRPGVVGHIGGVLGGAGINISRMQLGLGGGSGRALSVVSVDRPATQAEIGKLCSGDVISVRQVRLG